MYRRCLSDSLVIDCVTRSGSRMMLDTASRGMGEGDMGKALIMSTSVDRFNVCSAGSSSGGLSIRSWASTPVEEFGSCGRCVLGND